MDHVASIAARNPPQARNLPEISAREGVTQCWYSYVEPANQTACLADEQCNWDQSLDETQCTAPTDAQFCGDCHGGVCWDVTEPQMCYTWVESPDHCTTLGEYHCTQCND